MSCEPCLAETCCRVATDSRVPRLPSETLTTMAMKIHDPLLMISLFKKKKHKKRSNYPKMMVIAHVAGCNKVPFATPNLGLKNWSPPTSPDCPGCQGGFTSRPAAIGQDWQSGTGPWAAQGKPPAAMFIALRVQIEI